MKFSHEIIILSSFLLLGNGQNLTKKRSRLREENTERNLDHGALLSIKQAPKIQYPPNENEQEGQSRTQGVSREALRERLDSIILLLSRLSDRMVAVETKQNQQTERIDNINYRITKLDLQGEERKGQLSEVSANLRHRLQTTDNEMEKVETLLERISSEIGIIKEKGVEAVAKFDQLRLNEGQKGSNSQNGPGLQSIIAAVFDVKAKTQQIQMSLDKTSENITKVAKLTANLNLLSDSFATKKDLIINLADLKSAIDNPMKFYSPYQSSPDSKSKKDSPTDCWELLHKRKQTKSGVYMIHPTRAPLPFFVYCDMETDGGGWTVIQRREDGSIDFAKGWTDYKHGFGNLAGEFWIGNEKLYQLTNQQVNELQIILGDFSQHFATAKYAAFAIGSEEEFYALKLLGGYEGDAGDSLDYHVGQKWSTYDMDNDAYPDKNCARDHTGAWWYKSCDTSNLNGRYLHGPVPADHEYTGIYWYDYQGPQYSLWQSTMMIRRGGSVDRKKAQSPELIYNNTKVHPSTKETFPTKEEVDVTDDYWHG